MIRRITVILSLTATSIVLVVSLHWLGQKEIEHDDFVRSFIEFYPDVKSQWPLQSPKHYIAGLHGSTLYIADVFGQTNLLSVNWGKLDDPIDTVTIPISIKDSHIIVDSGGVYIADLNRFDIFRFQVNNRSSFSDGVQVFDSTFFVEAVPVRGEVFAIRTLNQSKEYVLALKLSLKTSPIHSPGILEKQIDGLFCTDGMLHFNADLKQLVYVYYYRNEFICMDTSLHLRYRSKTIDGVERVQIRVAEIKSDQAMALASPPPIVNKKSHSSGDWLFIHSAIKARNESMSAFNQHDVLDIYDLRNGRYAGSFYLPRINGEKLRDFKVYGNRLVAIHGRVLTTFDLHRIVGALYLTRPL